MSVKPSDNYVEVLLRGLLLRCPHCGQGQMFKGLFTMLPTCSVCGVRYERLSGESIGGMFINLGLAELISVGGFFVIQIVANPPMVPHIVFWIVFNILFVLLFYQHARGLWVAINYLSNGVYADRDAPGGPTPTGPGHDQDTLR